MQPKFFVPFGLYYILVFPKQGYGEKVVNQKRNTLGSAVHSLEDLM